MTPQEARTLNADVEISRMDVRRRKAQEFLLSWGCPVDWIVFPAKRESPEKPPREAAPLVPLKIEPTGKLRCRFLLGNRDFGDIS